MSVGFKFAGVKREWVRQRHLTSTMRFRDVLRSADCFGIREIIPDRSNGDIYYATIEGAADQALTIEFLNRLAYTPGDFSFLLFFGDRAIGLCDIILDEKKSDAWIKHIGIVSEFRRQGLATQLMSAVLKKLDEKNVNLCHALIAETNKLSIQLHQRFGFVPTNITGEKYILALPPKI